MLGAENWCMKVNNKIYGPYTTQQMRKFAQCGRLAGWSLVAPAGNRAWRAAYEDPAFAALFGVESSKNKYAENDRATFGRKDHVAAEKTTASNSGDDKQPKASSANAGPFSTTRPPRSFVICLDAAHETSENKPGTAHTLINAYLKEAGDVVPLGASTWLTTSRLTPIGLRNALTPYLAEGQRLFVAEAAPGKAAWRNFVGKSHARLTLALMASTQETSPRSASSAGAAKAAADSGAKSASR